MSVLRWQAHGGSRLLIHAGRARVLADPIEDAGVEVSCNQAAAELIRRIRCAGKPCVPTDIAGFAGESSPAVPYRRSGAPSHGSGRLPCVAASLRSVAGERLRRLGATRRARLTLIARRAIGCLAVSRARVLRARDCLCGADHMSRAVAIEPRNADLVGAARLTRIEGGIAEPRVDRRCLCIAAGTSREDHDGDKPAHDLAW